MIPPPPILATDPSSAAAAAASRAHISLSDQDVRGTAQQDDAREYFSHVNELQAQLNASGPSLMASDRGMVARLPVAHAAACVVPAAAGASCDGREGATAGSSAVGREVPGSENAAALDVGESVADAAVHEAALEENTSEPPEVVVLDGETAGMGVTADAAMEQTAVAEPESSASDSKDAGMGADAAADVAIEALLPSAGVEALALETPVDGGSGAAEVKAGTGEMAAVEAAPERLPGTDQAPDSQAAAGSEGASSTQSTAAVGEAVAVLDDSNGAGIVAPDDVQLLGCEATEVCVALQEHSEGTQVQEASIVTLDLLSLD